MCMANKRLFFDLFYCNNSHLSFPHSASERCERIWAHTESIFSNVNKDCSAPQYFMALDVATKLRLCVRTSGLYPAKSKHICKAEVPFIV